MPCTPRQVEKFRNHSAQPTTTCSTLATCPNSDGVPSNRALRSCSSVRAHSSGARSYSASSWTNPTTAGTSPAATGLISNDMPSTMPAELLRLVADRLDVVAVRVADEPTEVVGVV